MKIGIVVEGSYPYVSGGVSSWVHMLMEQMPMHEFEIISIMPNPKSEADYRYTLPKNVTGVTTLALNQRATRKRRPEALSESERERIKTWMTFGQVDSSIYPILENQIGTPEQFFSSRLFYQLITESYQEEGQAGSFIDYFWMWRSMYAPVLDLLQAELPQVDLVHAASTGYAGLIASAMKERQNIPFLLTEHGIYSREREEELLQASWIPAEFRSHWIQFFHHISREAYRKADDVITLFERNGELQRQLGAPVEKLSIIPNGIDVTGLSALGHVPGADKLRIGAIVRVVPIKDIKT
ncbi:MAG: GT4 family glycosyltransferase PelF, partial [Exiguobacterium sp.]